MTTAGPGSPGKHEAGDYCLFEPDAWCEQVATFEQFRQGSGSTVVLRGDCPRCSGSMTVDLPIQARCGQIVSDDRDEQALPPGKEFVKVACCNCGQPHNGRPESSLGCGTFASLRIGKGVETGARAETAQQSELDPDPLTPQQSETDSGGQAGQNPSEDAGAEDAHEQGPDSGAQGRRAGYVRVEPLPGEATVNDVEWEHRAEQQEIDALPAARSAAEKWTTQIASLTGIFSIVVLIKGPEDVTKLEGDVGRLVPTDSLGVAVLVSLAAVALVAFAYRRWPEQAWTNSTVKWTAQVLALGSIAAALLVWDQYAGWPATVIALLFALGFPAAAQLVLPQRIFADDTDWEPRDAKWTARRTRWTPGAARWTARLAGLGCMLSVGLIWAQQWAWQTAVIISLALALISAAVAVVAGGLAAYGIPARFAPASGEMLRTRQRAQIQRARNGLRISLGAAVAAIVFVAVAIAATWTNTPDETAPAAALLITRNGAQSPVCGRYAGENSGYLLVQQTGRTAPTRIPVEEVSSTASVPACPGE